MNIPENYLDLLKDETRAYLYLATVMPDGTPQVTPIWFNTEILSFRSRVVPDQPIGPSDSLPWRGFCI